MKKLLVIGALAIASVALSASANAQGVYLGFGNGPGYYGGQGGYNGGYRSYSRSYSYGDAYAQDYRQCRVVRIKQGHHYRSVRRCW